MTYKFDPSKVLYFSLVPFEGEVSMENDPDGDYVTREAWEQLLQLYRDLESAYETKHKLYLDSVNGEQDSKLSGGY